MKDKPLSEKEIKKQIWKEGNSAKSYPDDYTVITCLQAINIIKERDKEWKEAVERLKELFEERKPYEVIYKKIDEILGEFK